MNTKKFDTYRQKETTRTFQNTVIFVAVIVNNEVRAHAGYYLEAWRDKKCHIALVLQSDEPNPDPKIYQHLTQYADDVWIRSNVGYDFGAWSEYLLENITIDKGPKGKIFLVNDSLIGPINPKAFDQLIVMISESEIDLVAMTDNHDHGHHLQSYFLALSAKAINTPAVKSFFEKIENKNNVAEVVFSYEIPFGSVVQSAGLSISIVFPAKTKGDPTIFEASDLLRRGYPFVKRKCFFSAKQFVNTREILDTALSIGCDGLLIDYMASCMTEEGSANATQPSLFQLYRSHLGKVSDKWQIYLLTYDRIFSEFRSKPMRMLEIGVQNGGSLEIWTKYFDKTEVLVGCDINPKCNDLTYESSAISIIVGDANQPETEQRILQKSPSFNLIIDDGSHNSSDIVRSFCKYFSKLENDGIYVIEDLHCSYFAGYEGGLQYEYSSIEFLKFLADIVNYEHWSRQSERQALVKKITNKWGVEISDSDLASVHSVEFVNSICIVRKKPWNINMLGSRIIAGRVALVSEDSLRLK
jgi:cephalosporin hydroxylase